MEELKLLHRYLAGNPFSKFCHKREEGKRCGFVHVLPLHGAAGVFLKIARLSAGTGVRAISRVKIAERIREMLRVGILVGISMPLGARNVLSWTILLAGPRVE